MDIRREEVSRLVRGLFERCTQMEIQDRDASAVVGVKWVVLESIFDTMVRLIFTHRSYLGSAEEVEGFKEMINVTITKLLGAFNLGDYILFLRWLDLQGWERAMKKYSRQSLWVMPNGAPRKFYFPSLVMVQVLQIWL